MLVRKNIDYLRSETATITVDNLAKVYIPATYIRGPLKHHDVHACVRCKRSKIIRAFDWRTRQEGRLVNDCLQAEKES
jgi:hypothetical protein